jgi:hypothetical protein
MKRKKQARRKKGVPSLSLTDHEEDFVQSLLADFKTLEPSETLSRIPSPRLAEVLIERLPLDEAASIPLLSALQDRFHDKPVKKAIRRFLFKLEKQGIPVDDFRSQREAARTVLKPPPMEAPMAYLGPVGAMGYRAVLITMQRSTRGLEAGVGLVSDEHGIQQFLLTGISKKRLKEMKDQLAEEAGPLVEASLPHVTTVLERAYHRHLEIRPDVPPSYLDIRPRLVATYPVLQQAPIYELVPDPSLSQEPPTASRIEALFSHEFMQSWIIEIEQLRPFMEDMAKTEDSPIVLTDAQKADRISQIKAEASKALFPLPKRELLKQRLEEMAYVFFKTAHNEFAALALGAAQTLDQRDTLLTPNPIVQFLLDRSLNFYMETADKSREPHLPNTDTSSRIILP